MPSYIVKASPDEDWYVRWSTIVDAPCEFGTRAEMERAPGVDSAPERFARADERGTSADWPRWSTDSMPFGWQDAEFIVMEGSPPSPDGQEGCWVLPRKNLRAYCERVAEGDLAADLLRFDRDTPADPTTERTEA